MSETYIKEDREIKVDPLTRAPIEFITCEWVGDGGTVELSYHSLYRYADKDPDFFDRDVITLGNLRLRVIGRYAMYLVVARDGWKARIIKALWPIKKWWVWVWYRFILTLAVWGLVEHRLGTISSWRDIKVFKRFAK